MNLSCTQPLYADLIKTTAGGSCLEFWFNRYQTFIAAVVALFGAALTVNTMWRQTEAVRADEAEMRLARYRPSRPHNRPPTDQPWRRGKPAATSSNQLTRGVLAWLVQTSRPCRAPVADVVQR
jgi:hypothetical protein